LKDSDWKQLPYADAVCVDFKGCVFASTRDRVRVVDRQSAALLCRNDKTALIAAESHLRHPRYTNARFWRETLDLLLALPLASLQVVRTLSVLATTSVSRPAAATKTFPEAILSSDDDEGA
jgi:hypothetical protein